MLNLTGIAYVSSSAGLMSEAMLSKLLVGARGFNQLVDVTGVLLHDDGNFFQYFEGPAVGVAEVYGRITRSRSHHHLIELFHREVEERAFDSWTMGFRTIPHSQILRLAQADWHEVASSDGPSANSTGRLLLRSYWGSVARRG